MKKRIRTENWTARDKTLLRQLCTERVTIIENKCVDTENNRVKRECWNQINDAFNSVSEIKRDVVRIQFQWRNMKMKAKAAEAAYRNAINKPGGPPPQLPTKEERELVELISKTFQIDKTTVSDSDGAALQIKAENIADEILANFGEVDGDEYKDNEFEQGTEDYFTENNQTQDNISVYQHSHMQSSQDNVSAYHNHSHIQPSIKRSHKRKKIIHHDSEASQKKELFELTKSHMIEEHQERMAILEVEKQCRQKELEKLQLEMQFLQK